MSLIRPDLPWRPGKRYTGSAGQRLALLRPAGGFYEVGAGEIDDATAEMHKKLPLVVAGLDEFTACERLLYYILSRDLHQVEGP